MFLGGIKPLNLCLQLPGAALNIRLFLDESFSVAAFHNKNKKIIIKKPLKDFCFIPMHNRN